MGFIFYENLSHQKFVHFSVYPPTAERADSGNANTGVFGHFHVSASGERKSGLWYLPWPSLPYMDFDQNQELVHFGEVTPPQRGRIPEMPTAVCFGAENPLFFSRKKIASKCRN